MKNSYKIGIIGCGVVGTGISKLFDDDVLKYDPPKLGSGSADRKDFIGLDLAVICVPTPTSTEDGMSCDTSYVLSSISWLSKCKFEGIVMIKSAVPPGVIKKILNTYKKLRIVVSPEYMGESRYFTPAWKYPDPADMRSHTWQLFGGAKKDTSICVDIFKRKMGVDTSFIQTDAVTASLCKYMENCFFATKVTFCNEWYDIAEVYGVDYNELRECWLQDPRINKNHTLVFPKDRGYGGKCFPKDVKALIMDLNSKQYRPQLLTAVDATNRTIRGE